MSAPSRIRNPRGEGERLRVALMEAAADLLIEHGSAERLSIRSITARAGVSPTALYLHFADKEELLRAVCDEAFEELREFLATAEAEHSGDPAAQMRAIGEAYVDFAMRRPGLYRILFATMGPEDPDKDEFSAEDPGMMAFADLVRATERCLPEGRDPLAAAVQIWTALHGFVSLRTVLPAFDWPSTEEFLVALASAHLGAEAAGAA